MDMTQNEKKKLGVIGGLGPMASALFLQMLTAATDAECDQEHVETILYSRPQTPDRTAFLLGNAPESPLPMMIDSGRMLESLGCGVLVIPCMTAYGFYADLKEAFHVQLINPLEESAKVLRRSGCKKVGLMATDGTLQVGAFQRALEAQGLCPVLPDAENQREVMSLIYDEVKSGKRADMERFHAAAHSMRAQGAECVILGCTELSVINWQNDIGRGFLDAMEVLAECAVTACGYRVKKAG